MTALGRPVPVAALRRAGMRCVELEQMLRMAREERDSLALREIDRGASWRDVADAAGFANPYIATLKKRRGDT